MHRERVGWYDLKSFLCIFRNSFGVLHDRPLEKGLTATSDAYYNKFTYVSDKYRSHYDKTVTNCGPLLMHDNARKHMTNQTKNCCYTLSFDAHRHPPYSPDMALNAFQLFRPL